MKGFLRLAYGYKYDDGGHDQNESPVLLMQFIDYFFIFSLLISFVVYCVGSGAGVSMYNPVS